MGEKYSSYDYFPNQTQTRQEFPIKKFLLIGCFVFLFLVGVVVFCVILQEAKRVPEQMQPIFYDVLCAGLIVYNAGVSLVLGSRESGIIGAVLLTQVFLIAIAL